MHGLTTVALAAILVGAPLLPAAADTTPPDPPIQGALTVIPSGTTPLPPPPPEIMGSAAELLALATMERVWRLGPEDNTVRQALQRWAMDANWTFGSDQWQVRHDIPIEATAEIPGDFPAAVQLVAESVGLSSSPIRACFYANRVLRILPYNELCNRTAPRGHSR